MPYAYGVTMKPRTGAHKSEPQGSGKSGGV
jgi:hypothetical protein